MCGLNFHSNYTSFLVKVLIRMKRHKVHREEKMAMALRV